MRFPWPDPIALLRWSDGSPLRWLAVLAAASPWVRVAAGPVTLYPLHLVLTLLLAWALTGTQVQPPRMGGFPSLRSEVPLLPAVALLVWLALVTLFRFQWWALGGAVLGGACLWVWGWAASAVGRQSPGPRYFAEAALLYLAVTLLVGVATWAVQWWEPEVCIVLNCDPRAGIPYPFRGGWHSTVQYAVVLILLLPFCADPLMRSLRDSRAGRVRVAMLALTVCAGLALLAGAHWWLLLIVALGEALFARTLASDRHPLDRLFVRGMVFFTLFGAVALYGLAPGYLGPLLSGRGDSRSAGVQLPPDAPMAVLSSDRVTPVPIRLINTGWSDLRAGAERPLQVSALLLFTPRTGQTRAYPGGDLLVHETIAPGNGLDIHVPVRLPHWVNTGFVMWQLRDAAGTLIPINAGSRGFRFANASYYSLDQPGENQLTAISSRAQAPPVDAVEVGGDNLLGNAFDAIFFSPLWGHRGQADPGAHPLHVTPSLWLQLLHGYGLVGLGLAAWFGLRVLRQSWQLSQARERGGARMAWRLLPVSVFLLAALAMLSGEPARYHSLWGAFLLAGYVEGTHARQYPNTRRPRLVLPTPALLRRWWHMLGASPAVWRERLRKLKQTVRQAGQAGLGGEGQRLQKLGAPQVKLPGLRLPRLKLPGVRLPIPRIRLPRFLRRRPGSPLYPRGPRLGWRLPRMKLPRLKLPRWRRKPHTRHR